MTDPMLWHAVSGPIFHQLYVNVIQPQIQQIGQYLVEPLKTMGEIASSSSTLALLSSTTTPTTSQVFFAVTYGALPVLTGFAYASNPLSFAGHALSGDADLHLERLWALKWNLTVIYKKTAKLVKKKVCELCKIFND